MEVPKGMVTSQSISVIIPHMLSVPGADEALDECVHSLLGHKEIIVVVNDGIGYSKAVNIGLRLASGNFLCVANNDTKMIKGNLYSLADPFKVMVPQIIPSPRDQLPRSFFCMPRWIYEKVGEFDERFEGGYFEDDDYIRRLQNLDISISMNFKVVVHHRHGGGMTMKFLGEKENFDRNKRIFEEKWNEQ